LRCQFTGRGFELAKIPIHLRVFSLAVGSLVETKPRVAGAGFPQVCNEPRPRMPDLRYQSLIGL
jgi:hypothetical protein